MLVFKFQSGEIIPSHILIATIYNCWHFEVLLAWGWQTPLLLFKTALGRFYYVHCTDEKMETLRDDVTHPGLHSELRAELRSEPVSV